MVLHGSCRVTAGPSTQTAQLPSNRSVSQRLLFTYTANSNKRVERRSVAQDAPVIQDSSAVEVVQQQLQQEEVWDYVAPDHVLQRNQQ